MTRPQGINPIDLFNVTSLYPTPDFVKTANQADIGVSPTETDPGLYADPDRLALPCMTKAAAWSSFATWKSANFDRNDPQSAAIENRLLNFASYHGITEDCRSFVASMEKERQRIKLSATDGGLHDDEFAIVWSNDDGSSERHMPMRNLPEIIMAANYFMKKSSSFIKDTSYEFRNEVANKILSKAAANQANIDDSTLVWLEKSSGRGVCVPSEAASALRLRARVCCQLHGDREKESAESLRKLADHLEAQPASITKLDMRIKIASIIDEFDKSFGLSEQVARGDLASPEDIVFSIPFSKAAQAVRTHTSTITGTLYKLADVESLPLSQVRRLLGDELAGELTVDGVRISGEKAADVIPTLPRPDAEAFDSLMASNGLAGDGEKVAAASYEISLQFLSEIRERLGAGVN